MAAADPLASTNSVPIRKAATILLLRQGDAGVEVFMVQRPGRGIFPNLHVFPGGKVDPADDGLAHLCDGLDDRQASAQLGLPSGGLRYWVTAIRECFEECGVLLAYRDGQPFQPSGDEERARFDGYRNALAARRDSLPALAEREGLRLATDRVLYFSHWITPATAPARFDTRFYATHMPEGQQPFCHSGETVAGTWVRAADALARFDAGRWQMIHPTLTTLRTVSGFETLDALLGAVATGRHLGEVTHALHQQGMQHVGGD
ncbi:MAG: NUDIX domain-containing protein [Gammaproteobacteria bacterium]|nr:NUDIX domain-containing protein [Gammaproteobacteria bacterium]